MEFAESRPYAPGDDVRNLDWRVTARTGRTHTKLFREERERTVMLSVDYRAAMWFATRGAFKSVRVAQLASLLAWSASHHGDRVGGQIFSDHGCSEFKPEHGQRGVLRLIRQLAEAQAPALPATASETVPAMAMKHLQQHAKPGTLVFVLSDFRDGSVDSRSFGPVPTSALVGTIPGRLWPEPGGLPSPSAGC